MKVFKVYRKDTKQYESKSTGYYSKRWVPCDSRTHKIWSSRKLIYAHMLRSTYSSNGIQHYQSAPVDELEIVELDLTPTINIPLQDIIDEHTKSEKVKKDKQKAKLEKKKLREQKKKAKEAKRNGVTYTEKVTVTL